MKKSDFIYGTFLTIGLLGVMAAGQILNSDMPVHNRGDLDKKITQLRNARTVYAAAYDRAAKYSFSKMDRDTLYQRLNQRYNETNSNETLDSLNNYASELFNKYMHECQDLTDADNDIAQIKNEIAVIEHDCKKADSIRAVPITQRFAANWARLKNDIKSR